jgi:AcrR family transcriptional regulator
MPKVSQAHLDERRAHILKSARQCFSREGLNGATFQHIVAQSGLSAGAIYRYFASKDEIIEALSNERHAREREAIREAIDDADLVRALERLSQLFFGALQQMDERERRRIGIQLWAEALRNDRILVLVRAGVDEPCKLIAGLITQAQRRGLVRRELAPEAIARFLIALYHGFLLQQAWDPEVAMEPFLAVVEAAMTGVIPVVINSDS